MTPLVDSAGNRRNVKAEAAADARAYDYDETNRTTFGRRKRTVAPDAPLSPQMKVALGWLAEMQTPAYAFQVGHALREAGFVSKGQGHVISSQSRAAGNVLIALQRRGLVATNGTGGVFVHAKWSITDAGLKRAAEGDIP